LPEKPVTPVYGWLQRLQLTMDPENPKAVPSTPHQGRNTLMRISVPARIEIRLTFGKSTRILLAKVPDPHRIRLA